MPSRPLVVQSPNSDGHAADDESATDREHGCFEYLVAMQRVLSRRVEHVTTARMVELIVWAVRRNREPDADGERRHADSSDRESSDRLCAAAFARGQLL